MTDASENLENRPDGSTIRVRLLTPVFVTVILAVWAAVLSHEILGSDRLRPLTVYVEAARDLGEGQQITKEDLSVKLARRPDEKHKLITQPRQAVGLVTKSLIKGGQPLLRTDLVPPPKESYGEGKKAGGLIAGDRLAAIADIASILAAVLPRVVVLTPETVDDDPAVKTMHPAQRLSDGLKMIRLMGEILEEMRKFPGLDENGPEPPPDDRPALGAEEFERLLDVLGGIAQRLESIQSAIEAGGNTGSGSGQSPVSAEQLDQLRKLLEQLQAGSNGKSSLVDNLVKLVTAGGTAWEKINDSGQQKSENAFVKAYIEALGEIAAKRTDDLLTAIAKRFYRVLTGQSEPPAGPKSAYIDLHYTKARDLITGEQEKGLSHLIRIASAMPVDVNCVFIVTGHADATGQDGRNLEISRDRANLVAGRIRSQLADRGYSRYDKSGRALLKTNQEYAKFVENMLAGGGDEHSKKILVTWWGERRPAEWTEDGVDKQSNRRVEVEFHCTAPLVLPPEQ